MALNKKLEALIMIDTLRSQARGVIKGTTILEDVSYESFLFVLNEVENIVRESKRREEEDIKYGRF